MALAFAAKQTLLQLQQFLFQLNPADYKKPSQLLNYSTIGQHVRHTLEFFICLRTGVDCGTVDYDKRERNLLLEENKEFAIQTINDLFSFFEKEHPSHRLILRTQLGPGQEGCIEIASGYDRELAYNIEHAIHHMALIRVAVNEFCNYINLPENFGVASSTIRNRISVR